MARPPIPTQLIKNLKLKIGLLVGATVFIRKPLATYYHCGSCNSYHPANWDGDCRDDENRYSRQDLDDKHDGEWEDIDPPAD